MAGEEQKEAGVVLSQQSHHVTDSALALAWTRLTWYLV